MILCLIRIYFQPAASLVPTSHAPCPCRAWWPESKARHEEGGKKREQGERQGGRGTCSIWRTSKCPLDGRDREKGWPQREGPAGVPIQNTCGRNCLDFLGLGRDGGLGQAWPLA